MRTLDELLRDAMKMEGSDVFIIPFSPVSTKANGKIVAVSEKKVTLPEVQTLIDRAYELAGRNKQNLERDGDDDFSFAIRDVSRFRCNIYRQRGSLAAVFRVVAFGLPDPQKRHIPDLVMKLAELRSGMVLVTGPAGTGKSTTLACILDKINQTRDGHIITIEDPIEYLHPHKKCLVSQREVPEDASSFARAVRAALREAPDVIMLGEMRDIETISTAITAAETGHLLFSTLHTLGAAKTIDRVIDAFPAEQQNQVRTQLSMVLKAVVSQRLLLGSDRESGHSEPDPGRKNPSDRQRDLRRGQRNAFHGQRAGPPGPRRKDYQGNGPRLCPSSGNHGAADALRHHGQIRPFGTKAAAKAGN